jgi:large subunit ribosomal protein L22
MKYSYNQDKTGVVFANAKDLNASYKDLGAVCDAIRYKSTTAALAALDRVIVDSKPILYRKHNINMGARHELGGRKGRTPIKCAKIVRKVLVNAMANATNKQLDPEAMYVVHAAANKTMIARRFPSKGSLYVTGGPSGQVPARHSDIEFSRVEIGVSMLDERRLSRNIVGRIKTETKSAPKPQKKEIKKEGKKDKKQPLVKIQKKEEPKKEEKKEETKQAQAPQPAQKVEQQQAVNQ